MGVYHYALKTKSRRFKIGGEKVDVHPVEYFYKHETKGTRLTEARMEAAWDRRDPPKYIAFSGFEDGCAIYRGWPTGVVVASEYIENSLEFVGFLRERDGKLVVEEWTVLCLGRELDHAASWATRKTVIDLGIDHAAVRVYTPNSHSSSERTTRVAFMHANDAVIGKVALL